MTARTARPWHERVPVVSALRRKARSALFAALRKIALNPDGRDILVRALDGVHAPRDTRPAGLDPGAPSPYPDLGAARCDPVALGQGAIFITARFRSGSTLLWNIFRNAPGFTAYYEPHNERRWFDPACRGDRVDGTHRGVSDYWAEYQGLEDLARYYNEDW